jgi:ATP-binding cassette subfamily C protein
VGSVVILSLMLYVGLAVLNLATADALLMVFLFARLIPRFNGLQQTAQTLVSLLPACLVVDESERQSRDAREATDGPLEPISFERSIDLVDVSVSYGQGRLALDNVTLTIQAGRTTAVVGASGAGKTTIVDLVTGLIAPTSGAVMIDGRTLSPSRRRSWQAVVGYVPQDPFLFHDTVRANLIWPSRAETRADIERALALAAAEFVERLPQGLDTVVGDRGVLLSAGERQRLALARALLRNPAVLVLDEATSSLDSQNESRIQRAIEALHGRLTILVIAHRLSTIRHADVIHVVEGGRLVQSGTWSDLIMRGRFAELCEAQGRGPASDVEQGFHPLRRRAGL